MTGSAAGISTRSSVCRASSPSPRAASTGDDAAQQHELGVDDQREDRRPRPQPERRDEQCEQREAGDRVERARGAEDHAADPRPSRGDDPQRERDGQRDRERDRHERDVDAEQRGDAQRVGEDVAHRWKALTVR
jgi:hypothetical protein